MFRCISFFLVAPILWMMLAEDATRSPRRILEDIYGFAYFVEGGVIRSQEGVSKDAARLKRPRIISTPGALENSYQISIAHESFRFIELSIINQRNCSVQPYFHGMWIRRSKSLHVASVDFFLNSDSFRLTLKRPEAI